MGQSTSSDSTATQKKTVSNAELSDLFCKACSRHFQPVELFTIKNNMKKFDKDQNELISELEFQMLLGLPDESNIVHKLYQAVKLLCQFPLINHNEQNLTFNGLIKAITLINPDRYGKVLTKDYNYIKLIFVALAFESIEYSKETQAQTDSTQKVAFKTNGTVSWLDVPSVQSYDSINVESLYISGFDLLDVIAFLLVTSRLEPQESLKIYETNFKQFDEYKKFALPILRSMNPEINSKNLRSTTVTYSEFVSALENVAPNLLNPLSSFLEILLFDIQDQPDKLEKVKTIHTTSRLINEFSLAQLSTFLRRELVYSNIRKLYVGADSGFSMRSFESKAFKWNAPSLLFIQGIRIPANSKNSRYIKFDENFPKYRGDTNPHHEDIETVTYGVYIDQPWRISNKETFGNEKTTIFQLSPQQKIFKTSPMAKNHVYFNTLGGGIGIGSAEPTVKNNFLRYNPGNVSLTIDSTLEFAVFRHLGIGGEFKSVDAEDWSREYEDRILIKNVEVWGCGGEKELEEQNKRWEWEQAEAKRRQQVNIKSMGEDRALLEMAGLVGGHQSGGSV